MGDLKAQIAGLGKAAKSASKQLRTATTEQKNQALIGIKNAIDQARISILSANQNDLKLGKKDGLDAALLDRLMLDNDRIDAIITSLEQIAALPDPIGEITDLKYQPSGIQVGKMRMPLGVIGIIYESRPNVTIDAAALCLKSGNAAILRGGSEALNSNLALYDCIQKGLKDAGLNPYTICLIDTKEHAAVAELSRSDQYLDAIIPRGGKGLIEALNKTATIPVIKHLHGVCHTYIDKDADTEKAIAIAFNAKTRRYGVCNATETLLVHNLAAKRVMPELVAKLLKKGVELRGCEKTRAMFQQVIPATKEDWATEYLAPVLSVRIVDSINDAIDHIEKYGSKHTESIICENFTRARKFLTEVDSSSVMLNASTAFADGFEYGLGAEIGISTDKFHVRGPVGLEGLTSQKYIVLGNGNTRP